MADRASAAPEVQAPEADLSSIERPGVPEWVPHGQEERFRNAATVARNTIGDGHDDAVWQLTRTIFHDRTTYPD